MSDLISRQAAIDAFDCTNELIVGGEANAQNVVNYINKVVGKIKELPSAQQERKTGKWIWDDEGYHCSECFFHAYGNTLECMDGTYKYCPNCGARMVQEGEDNERA